MLVGVAVLLVAPACASAGTYFVSTSGSNANNCTASGSACQTIAGALSRSRTDGTAPDTIKVAAGEYQADVKLNDTADAGLTLTGAASSGASQTTIRQPDAAQACGGMASNLCAIQVGSSSSVANDITIQHLAVGTPSTAGDKRAFTMLSSNDVLSDVVVSMGLSTSTEPGVQAEGANALLDRVTIDGTWNGAGVLGATDLTVQDSNVAGGCGGIFCSPAIKLLGGPMTTSGGPPPRQLTVRRSRLRIPLAGGFVVEAGATANVLIDSSLITGGDTGVSVDAGGQFSNVPGAIEAQIRNSTIDPGTPGATDSTTPVGVRANGHETTSSATATIDSSTILHADLAPVTSNGGTASITCTFNDVLAPSGATPTGLNCPVGSNGNTSAQAALFVGGNPFDYHLAPGSAGIDTGNPAALSGAESATDLDGVPRVRDGNGDCTAVRDKGAFERAAANCVSGTQQQKQQGGAQNGGTANKTLLAAASGLAFSPSAFAAESNGPPATNARKKAPRGTKVSFQLNEPVSVRFTVTRRAKGRKVKKGKKTVCTKPTRKNRKHRRCTRVVTLKGSFTRNGVAGKNSFHFTGRLRGRRLKPGRYRLVATPSANGKTGNPTSTGFRIVR